MLSTIVNASANWKICGMRVSFLLLFKNSGEEGERLGRGKRGEGRGGEGRGGEGRGERR